MSDRVLFSRLLEGPIGGPCIVTILLMLEIQQRALGSGESAAGAMLCIYLRNLLFHLSVCLIYFCLIFV